VCYKITVDIEGSSNLRIDGGETFIKKTIEVKAGGRGDVLLRLQQKSVNASLKYSMTYTKISIPK